MRQKLIIAAVLVLAAGAAGGYFAFFQDRGQENAAPRVCLKNNCYQVELAKTAPARARGLMFRQNLDEDKGMLFVFEYPQTAGFWMKNTLIPLDIVWIGEDKKIVFVSQDTPPCAADPCPSYGPQTAAKYVLELNAGRIKKIGAAIGDEAVIEY